MSSKVKDEESVTFFEFSYDWEKALESEEPPDDFTIPSVQISSISMSGKIVISFSDPFIVPDNLD